MAPRGRPSKLTPELQANICLALRGGNFREAAAEWQGISAETMSRWIKRGADDEEAGKQSIYRDFRQAVLKAEREAEIDAVAKIMKAGVDDPKHLQWWLERKFPERWGRRVTENRHEHSGPGGGPIEVKTRLEHISDAELAALLATDAGESGGGEAGAPEGADG